MRELPWWKGLRFDRPADVDGFSLAERIVVTGGVIAQGFLMALLYVPCGIDSNLSALAINWAHERRKERLMLRAHPELTGRVRVSVRFTPEGRDGKR